MIPLYRGLNQLEPCFDELRMKNITQTGVGMSDWVLLEQRLA